MGLNILDIMLDKCSRKRVSSFKEIELHKIVFVSIFYKNGLSTNKIGEMFKLEDLQALNDLPFLFAVINLTGRESVIIDKKER